MSATNDAEPSSDAAPSDDEGNGGLLNPEVIGPTNDAEPSFVLMASKKLKNGQLSQVCVWEEKVRDWGEKLIAQNMEMVRESIVARDDFGMAAALELTTALRNNRDLRTLLGKEGKEDGRLQA